MKIPNIFGTLGQYFAKDYDLRYTPFNVSLWLINLDHLTHCTNTITHMAYCTKMTYPHGSLYKYHYPHGLLDKYNLSTWILTTWLIVQIPLPIWLIVQIWLTHMTHCTVVHKDLCRTLYSMSLYRNPKEVLNRYFRYVGLAKI